MIRKFSYPMFLVSMFVVVTAFASAAFAQASPDPVGQTTATLSTLQSLLHGAGVVPFFVVLAFSLLQWGEANVAFLARPNIKHYLAPVIGGLALLAARAGQGTMPGLTDAIAALGTAWALWKQGATPSSKMAQAGFVRVNALVVMLLPAAILGIALGVMLSAPTGCGGGSSTVKTIESDVEDCTKGQSASLLQLFAGLAQAGLQYATNSDGTINTSTLKSEGFGSAEAIGGCLLADAFKLALGTAQGSGAPKASALVIDPKAAAAAMHELYPGKHFHTPHGDL